MSIVKSFSVGNGDLFYINHDSDNFTMIDCCLNDDKKEEKIKEIVDLAKNKGVIRFISTHPDDDHIHGLKDLANKFGVLNFYCVENQVNKEKDKEDFNKYYELRDGEYHYYLKRGCVRRWMNLSDEERKDAGINILWPDTSNINFKEELAAANEGKRFNNISPIIQYSENNVSILWFGDLEADFMEKIKGCITLPKVDIIFAPHHGRKSGELPKEWIEQMKPTLIIIGAGESKDLCYCYSEDTKTITQNSAGDIVLICKHNSIYICVSNDSYEMSGNNNNKIEFYKDKKNEYGKIICRIILKGN
ncbi:MAG: hypothetical protein IJS60_03445 [Abditibacteriota bacterium]|nr:hypothetical protein [Abditibacteriota bacterium]